MFKKTVTEGRDPDADEKKRAHVHQVKQTLDNLPASGRSDFLANMREYTFRQGTKSRETRVKDGLAEYVRTHDVQRQAPNKFTRNNCDLKRSGADIIASFTTDMETTRPQVSLDIVEHNNYPTSLSVLLDTIVLER